MDRPLALLHEAPVALLVEEVLRVLAGVPSAARDAVALELLELLEGRREVVRLVDADAREQGLLLLAREDDEAEGDDDEGPARGAEAREEPLSPVVAWAGKG